MLSCESCADALSTTAGKRPVSFCDHILCESCVADDGSCPLCNLKTDLTGDDRVSRDLLKLVSKPQGCGSKTVKYPCDNHGSSEVKFICYEHKAALCTECVWNHRDHHKSVKEYSSTDVQADLLLACDILDNHINQCQELRKSATDKVAQGEVFLLLQKVQGQIKKISDKKLSYTEAIETNAFQIDSALLNEVEVRIIISMLGIVNPTLQLLFRASRDGDSAQQFHARCDNKGPTLVVVSAKGKKFGGFTTTSWTSVDYTWNPGDKRNFLFHLDPDFVLRCVDGSQRGTYSNPSWGPWFGGGHALGICNGCLSNTYSGCRPCKEYPTSDENHLKCIKDLGKFQVTDYEVFAITM